LFYVDAYLFIRKYTNVEIQKAIKK